MRIPRIYKLNHFFVNDIVTLKEKKIVHYIKNVLRKKKNDYVKLFNNKNFIYLTVIQLISNKLIILKIIHCINENNESKLRLHLGQIISKNKNMDIIIQKSVELGVSKITPIFNKSLKKILNKEYISKKMEHWKKIIISTCQQCERNIIPKMNEPKFLDQWFQEKTIEKKIFFEKNGNYTIKNLNSNIFNIRILIGSEHGFSKEDKISLLKNGFMDLSLGPRILRMETAVIAAISCLQLKLGDF